MTKHLEYYINSYVFFQHLWEKGNTNLYLHWIFLQLAFFNIHELCHSAKIDQVVNENVL